ncbi:hypothetical protein EVAR_62670_1 [Eumeta japonica]|uniref:Uncharacterized protein n=1 Tax=Eumeta variegata TaxID=151549 RepID=A0A4C1Z3X6_EUMVA|nr:hypothetical protein EVAR_62670_1 [Eumeta japonica]
MVIFTQHTEEFREQVQKPGAGSAYRRAGTGPKATDRDGGTTGTDWTDAPTPLQFISGASACIYELHTIQSKGRSHAFAYSRMSVRSFLILGYGTEVLFLPQAGRLLVGNTTPTDQVEWLH